MNLTPFFKVPKEKYRQYKPGAIITSCFFVFILRKLRSLLGSKSLTELLALFVRLWITAAYWTVVELSRVVLMGIPVKKDLTNLKSS